MIKCSCGGRIWSLGTNRYACDNDNCKKRYKKNCNGRVLDFEDLEEIK